MWIYFSRYIVLMHFVVSSMLCVYVRALSETKVKLYMYVDVYACIYRGMYLCVCSTWINKANPYVDVKCLETFIHTYMYKYIIKYM